MRLLRLASVLFSLSLVHGHALPSASGLSSRSDTELIDLATASIPTVKEAAVQARKLLLDEKISTLSTVFPEDHELSGLPIGLMDYYADCSENGDPTLLAIKIATSFKNVKEGGPISLSIRQHKEKEFFSPAAHPRLSLIGHLTSIPSNSAEADRLKKCFTRRHPDAKLWLPGNNIHESEWVRFEVSTIYWIGGFGNVAYIGYIPKELYANVTLANTESQEAYRETGEQMNWDWKRLFVQGTSDR